MTPPEHPRKESTRKSIRARAQELLDANVIGLLIDPDFDPKTEEKPRALSAVPAVLEPRAGSEGDIREKSASPQKRIKNYVIFNPYPNSDSSLFLHGRDIFTPETARQFYEKKNRKASLFNANAIEKIKNIFLPQSFSDRVEAYFLSNISYISNRSDINWIDFIEGKLNTLPYAQIVKKKIKADMTAELDAYLAEPSDSQEKTSAKVRFASELRQYMERHDWDFEILNNFKAAIRFPPASQTDTLEALLCAGARKRAVEILSDLVLEMENPYDDRFVITERYVARMLTGCVQPRVLDYALKDKTAMLFSNASSLKAFETNFGFNNGFAMYNPSRPLSSHFSNFLRFANEGLYRHGGYYVLPHEFAHKVDADNGTTFTTRFEDTIPSMIEADTIKLIEVETFIHGINADSPQEDLEELIVLATKRGIKKTENMEVDTLKKILLREINYIKNRVGRFVPQFKNIYNSYSYSYINQKERWFEIPAVMEDLKGTMKRPFIAAILPQLSHATDYHRRKALSANRTQAYSGRT